MDILHPAQIDQAGESTVRQFEKFEPVFEHLRAVNAFTFEFFQTHFKHADAWEVESQPVIVEIDDKRKKACNEGLAHFHETNRRFGAFTSETLVLMREPCLSNRPLYWAASNVIEYRIKKIHFSYSILEIHPLGLVDYSSGSRVVDNQDFELIHTGRLGPYILRPGETDRSDKDSIIINTNEHNYRTELKSMTRSFESVVLSDDDFLRQIQQSNRNLSDAIETFAPWMLKVI